MTVASAVSRISYNGNGSTTAFAVPYYFLENSHLQVILTTGGVSTVQTITTNYTVTGAGNPAGGTVNMLVAPASGTQLTIVRDVPATQETDYQGNDPFPAESHERALDKLTMLVQENDARAIRSIRAPITDPDSVNMELPSAASRADKLIQFDTNGDVDVVSTTQFIAGLAGAVIGANYITNNATGDGVTVAYTLSSAPGAKGNLQIYIDGVYQNKATFSLAGTTVTFTEAPPLNASVEFIIGYSIGSTSGDATGIDFTQQGTGAVSRTVANKLYEFVSVKDFGAVGDGVTDDTAAIQAAFDSGAKIVTGSNDTYVVTTVIPNSNQTVIDMKFLAKPETSTVYLRPVIKLGGIVGGSVQTVTNVTLYNIYVDGNRSNLASISTAYGEDGGMHGYKISNGASNIKLINCEAHYCGSAGLALHGEGSGAATYPIENIYAENFSATYNREHGMFGDSFDGFYINRALFNNNGSELASGYPTEHGNSAFTHMGANFGSGFDLECYVGNASTYFKNFYASDVICKGNATTTMIYAPPVVDAVAEIPAQNIFMKNMHLEKGTNSGITAAFTMTADSFVGTKYGIDTVHLSGFLDGIITSNNVRGFSFTDGFIKAPTGTTYKALLNNSLDTYVTCASNRDNVRVQTFGSVSVSTDTGVGTLSISISEYVKSIGSHKLILPLSVSGGLISGGDMSWTITLPSEVAWASTANINAYNTTSGESVVSNVAVISDTELRIFMTPTDDTISGVLELEALI